MILTTRGFAALLCLMFTSLATTNAQVVYQTGAATGFFTPFDANTPAGTLFGDSGYFGDGSSDPSPMTSITLGLATIGSGNAVGVGSTDIVFTLNDGDPSGLVFGPGTTLYSETFTNVMLPAADATAPSYFSLTVPLPNPMTSGGFNNFGFSVGVENFDFDGQFGFQNRGDFNDLGFYTNNASEFNPGAGWSLFAFGPNDPADIANFGMTLTVPEPAGGMFGLFGVVAILAIRRCRRPRR